MWLKRFSCLFKRENWTNKDKYLNPTTCHSLYLDGVPHVFGFSRSKCSLILTDIGLGSVFKAGMNNFIYGIY